MNKSSSWFVYIIKTQQDKLYTGITTDIERRWHEHLVSKKGAKFFRTDAPKSVVFACECENRSEASKLEAKIKKMNRANKIVLIQSTENQLTKVKLRE